MVMDGYYVNERLPELWSRINVLHLGYLEMEESPKKIEQRNKLEDCVKEFLCIAPHDRKFYFKETAEVLHRSASSKKDFSGYKAALGWNAISMYAGNLIAQPWRQEYREIKMYSGFYKHQIEANLVGAEIMFEAMGYKHVGNGALVLEGPICPDRVTNVSQDSLVAYVECQILKEIWEEVCSASYKITWLEVLQFRETYLCSPRKSIESLKYEIQQRQYQQEHHHRSFSQGSNEILLNNNYRQLSAVSAHPQLNHHLTSPTAALMNHSFPPLASHHPHGPLPSVLPPPPPPCVFNGYNCNYNLLPHYTYPPNQYVMKQPYSNYYCNGHVQPHYIHQVPTGQLIEIDRDASPNGRGYDVPDGKPSVENHQSQKASNDYVGVKNRDDAERYGSWDYVYKNLESLGYSKDLGERGDILNNPIVQRDKKPKEHELKVSDRPLKINEALEQMNLFETKRDESKLSMLSDPLNSSYENISGQELQKKPAKGATKAKDANEDKMEKVKSLARVFDGPKKKLDKIKNKDKAAKAENATDKWECRACTFLNARSVGICEMCGKSKVKISNEMEVGGSECSKCTLVNPKDKKICEACGASLHNSPTYI